MNTNMIIEVCDTMRALHNARRARIEAAFREENSDIPPTVDSRGRYHAPIDGYMLPEGWEFANDRVYGAGQFIPTPVDPDAEYFFCGTPNFEHKTKVRATVSQIEEIAAFIEANNIPANITHGKSWQMNGVQVAYAYVGGQWKSLVKTIVGCLEEMIKPVIEQKPEVYLNGKATVTGEVVKVKAQESYYGYQLKMLVITAEGHKLYGSVPSAIGGVQRGDVVAFTANFESGEQGMSWFKRPTKASVVSAAVAA
jgi:hypothetical protein